MARNMGCEPEFIMGQRKTTSETHFACHVRGYTEKAVSVSTTLGLLQSAPQASAAVRQLAVERNRLALVAPAAIEEGPVSEAKSAEAEVPTIDPRAEVPQAEAEPQPNPPASIPDQPKPRRRLW